MSESLQGEHDLLTSKIFVASTKGGPRLRLTLPEFLTRLIRGDAITGFPNLAAPERSHWWRFLVRCGAKVLHELGVSVEEASSEGGAELDGRIGDVLAALVPVGGWCLSQPDPAVPGFLQPPTPTGASPEESYKRRTVAALTPALGEKDHDRKYAKGRVRTPEQTVYALLAYQGGVVYGGPTYYKTPLSASRSGAGSGVPFMWGRLAGDLPSSFRADVDALLANWSDVQSERGVRGTVWALWAESWDGNVGIPADELDVAFIPMARMVRLGPPTDGKYGLLFVSGTKTDRVNDHTQGGHLGDLFTPLVVDPKGGYLKVRGTLRGGYGYREVVKLLFGEGAACSPSVRAWMKQESSTSNLKVVFEGLAFGQGKTEGFHHREVLLPPEARPFLDDPRPLQEVDEQLMRIVSGSKKAIAGATRSLLHGNARPKKGDDGLVARSGALLDQRVDQRYLSSLVRYSDAYSRGETDWIDEWVSEVSSLAREAFTEGAAALPTSTSTMFERRVRAEAYLNRRLKKLRSEPE